jgi:hypothetical protein
VREPERQRAEDVRQRIARHGRGDLRRKVALGDRHQLDLDAGLIGESVDDGLLCLDAILGVLHRPEGERIALALAVVGAGCRRGLAAAGGQDEGQDEQRRAASKSHGLSPPHTCDGGPAASHRAR